ncbi:MAG: saccharopine dehydrogenase NADP-binding domain-containing protein [Acidobacteria bacterium]|jgi:saccharopine dehydrogenase-like NADP-dependent oxidoreductase|nr:saccharopine dehydrogenase NADP-binding domain-containing protein [Acidobacteriota bacterium]
MKVLLLGVGMQGKAALHDLCHEPAVGRIVAADSDLPALRRHVRERGYGDKVACERVDAGDPASLLRLMKGGHDVTVDLLPSRFSPAVARAAIASGVHLVNTVYVLPEMRELEPGIAAAGLTFLPEFGMDPGIDLVLLGRAAGLFDRIDTIDSYGAGIPEPGADDNPLRYKMTWTFAGVLRAYMRGGRLVHDNRVVEIGSREMFSPGNVHEVEIPGLGRFEAYANGDALPYAAMLGIDPLRLRRLGRYSFRWPGHCAFWKKLVDLRLLDDEPLEVDGVTVNKRNFLAAAIEPHIRLGDRERDIAVIRIDVSGVKDGRKRRAVLQVIDYRDLESGFTAMNRTVGYTAAIGALMIADGRLARRGLLSPLRDVPYELFRDELARRGIRVSEEITEPA